MGGAAWSGRQGTLWNRGASAVGKTVDVTRGVVVVWVLRGRVGFDVGEFHTATLLSRLRPHHGYTVIPSPDPHPQGVQFTLDRRVPFQRRDGFPHAVVQGACGCKLKLLLWHLHSSILSFL